MSKIFSKKDKKFWLLWKEIKSNISHFKCIKKPKVYLFNPEHIKLVFKNETTVPQRPPIEPLLKLHEKIGISSTLLNSQTERWRKLRTASNPILARPQTIYSYLSNQNQVANELVKVIDEKFAPNQSVLYYEEFNQILRLLALECKLSLIGFWT